MRLLLAALLLAPPQETPLEKRISIDVRGPFAEILEAVRKASGANVHVKPGAKGLDLPTELVLKDVKTVSALRWLARLYDLEVLDRDGIAVFGTDLAPRIQRSYEARRLLPGVTHRAGPALSLPPPYPLRIELTEAPIQVNGVLGREILIDLIKWHVAPRTWENNATIEQSPEGDLLVFQRADVHDELAWFLDSLRQSRRAAVEVTAEIAEGIDVPPFPRILEAAEAEGFSRKLQALKPLRLQTSGLDDQQVHAIVKQETSGIVGVQNGKAIFGMRPSEIALLDVRPSLLDGSRAALELRLALGGTRPMEAATTPAGALPRHETSLLSLNTTVIVPNGGAAVFVLPWKSSTSGKAPVCLLRATWTGGGLRPPLFSPERPRSDLLERLKALPPADVDLSEAPLADLAAWIRRVGGFNVVIPPDAAGSKVTIRARGVAPAAALALALEPAHLLLDARDEAIQISSRTFQIQDRLRTMILDVRDAIFDPGDRPVAAEEGPRAAFTGEDIANLMKNTVRRDAWEEADGKSIGFEDGMLFARNEPDVLEDCRNFVDDRRRQRLRAPVSLHADLLTLEAAAEEALGPSTPLIDAATRAKLLAAGRAEPLGWIAFERQRTSVSWDRSLAHIADYDGADPILRGRLARSYLDLRPSLDPDGATVMLEARFREERVGRMKSTILRDGLRVDLPVLESVGTHATVALPRDRWAVLRFPLPPEEGKPARVRLLLLGAAPLR